MKFFVLCGALKKVKSIYVPVPVKLTFWGLPPPLSVMETAVLLRRLASNRVVFLVSRNQLCNRLCRHSA